MRQLSIPTVRAAFSSRLSALVSLAISRDRLALALRSGAGMTDAPLSLRKLASAAHESVVGDELTGVGIDGRLKAPEQLASRPETPAWPCAWRVRGLTDLGLPTCSAGC